jgi:multimeric flavodoxin WrbA
MKVLAISGSPRKGGNTDHALKSILRTLKVDAKAETEFLSIVDHEIEHCRGCRHCMTHVECIIKGDDLEPLVEKLHGADLILLGAPIYWWGPPGVFKDFVDRTHAFYPDDNRFKGKKVAVVTVAADSGFPSHEKIMSWLAYYGAEYVCWLRLFARELGELQGKLGQMRKLDKFSGELVDALS